MSAGANVAALFPPPSDQKLNDDLNWQPIPVHTVPMKDDYMLAAQKQCDRYDFEMQKITNGTMYKELLKRHKPLLDSLQENSGFSMTRLIRIAFLYDTLRTEQLKGRW